MICPDCPKREMRIVFWNLHAVLKQPTLVVYQCDDCKRVEIAIE